MPNYYYSGQGSLYIAERNEVTGKPKGFLPIGNVPALTLNIETSKLEHKESETGSRLIDLTIITEKKGSFEFTLENLSLDNLSLALWGTKAVVAPGTVAVGAPESIVIPQDSIGGMRFPLAHPNVNTVVVKDNAGVVTYLENEDYIVDAENGTLQLVAGGDIVTAADTAEITIKVSYAYLGYTKMDAFTQANPPTRWLRFEGINTVDNSTVIVDLFKAQFEPMTGYGLLNDELGSVSMKGALLADTLQTSGSQFFRQINAA